MFKRKKSTLTKEQRKRLNIKYLLISVTWLTVGCLYGLINIKIKYSGALPTYLVVAGLVYVGIQTTKIINNKYDL